MGKSLYNLKLSRVFRYTITSKTESLKTTFEKLDFKTQSLLPREILNEA